MWLQWTSMGQDINHLKVKKWHLFLVKIWQILSKWAVWNKYLFWIRSYFRTAKKYVLCSMNVIWTLWEHRKIYLVSFTAISTRKYEKGPVHRYHIETWYIAYIIFYIYYMMSMVQFIHKSSPMTSWDSVQNSEFCGK